MKNDKGCQLGRYGYDTNLEPTLPVSSWSRSLSDIESHPLMVPSPSWGIPPVYSLSLESKSIGAIIVGMYIYICTDVAKA
jgi:hypothetical protein